jgi:hypothetical protein
MAEGPVDSALVPKRMELVGDIQRRRRVLEHTGKPLSRPDAAIPQFAPARPGRR